MRTWAGLVAGLMLAAPITSSGQGFDTNPVLKAGAEKPVSPHVQVLMGFPNVGFVIGTRGVLVVDTGLGDPNGALLAREAMRLAPGRKLYLTTTHFHPEHAAGQGGFPAGTTVIRNRSQQAELDADGARMIALFASRNEQMRALLAGATVGKADVLYDRDYTLDLGGVHVRLFSFGPAHTQGDEIVYVPEDSLILPGDVVENRLSPNIICDTCSPKKWIAVLDHIAPLKPTRVVPDHGELGDGSLVAQERAFLVDLQARAMALKAEGKTADEAGRIVSTEFTAKYQGWAGMGNLTNQVRKAYADPS